MSRLGIVTGLRREVRCLAEFAQSERPTAGCAGADPVRARNIAQNLLAAGCDALLSFGIAGGLDPALRPGDTIVADAVATATGQRIATMETWRLALWATLDELPGARLATVAGSDIPLHTVAEKQSMRHTSDASVVDMESHAVAEVAKDAEVPFLALRVVADTSADVAPKWVADCVGEQGEIKPLALTAGILTHPGDVSALVRLTRSSSAAFAGLRRASLMAGPRFRLG